MTILYIAEGYDNKAHCAETSHPRRNPFCRHKTRHKTRGQNPDKTRDKTRGQTERFPVLAPEKTGKRSVCPRVYWGLLGFIGLIGFVGLLAGFIGKRSVCP